MSIDYHGRICRGIKMDTETALSLPDEIYDEWVYSSDLYTDHGDHILGYQLCSFSEGTFYDVDDTTIFQYAPEKDTMIKLIAQKYNIPGDIKIYFGVCVT